MITRYKYKEKIYSNIYELSEALGQEGIFIPVAPVRERGLKWLALPKSWKLSSRSREGAWIEIRNTVGFSVLLTQMTYSD